MIVFEYDVQALYEVVQTLWSFQRPVSIRHFRRPAITDFSNACLKACKANWSIRHNEVPSDWLRADCRDANRHLAPSQEAKSSVVRRKHKQCGVVPPQSEFRVYISSVWSGLTFSQYAAAGVGMKWSDEKLKKKKKNICQNRAAGENGQNTEQLRNIGSDKFDVTARDTGLWERGQSGQRFGSLASL